MDSGKCPSCGAALGAGPLAGLCPRCLLAGGSRASEAGDDGAEPQRAAVAVLHDESTTEPNSTVADSPSDVPAGPRAPAGVTLRSAAESTSDAGSGPASGAGEDFPEPGWSERAAAPRIEGYQILRELNHGGQGVVYVAVQQSTKRKVAVKVLLLGAFASRSARRRFEREIELVAGLKHPNIIAVFDSGTTADGQEFYVMDYVRGVPLTQYVREKALGLEQVLTLFATTCDAVNHAHLRGVIHRDLKPSNILVDHEGNLCVLDFGLAKAMVGPAESIVSVTGSVLGTYPYMSPEQTRANPDEMDTRTDVYALGVILYEALTGTYPYPVTGAVTDVVRHIAETPPAPASRAWSGGGGVCSGGRRGRRLRGRCPIDSDLETILLKALAKERERRYDNAGHFARDIRRYLADQPIVARRPSSWYQLRMFSRRHRALVVATVGIFLGLVLGVIATTWVALALRVANERLRDATESIGNFMAFGGDERADGRDADLVAARRLYLNALDKTLEYEQPGSGSAILAGLMEIGTRPGGGVPLMGSYGGEFGPGGFRGHSAQPNNVAVLKKSRRALTGGTDGELSVWDLDTGRRLANVMTAHRSIAYVAASPDGSFAFTGGDDGTVRRWRLDPLSGGETVLSVDSGTVDGAGRPKTEPVWMVAVSADGRRVLAGSNTGRIVLRSADGTVRTVGECGESCAGLAFLPRDDRYALSGDHNGNIQLWDLEAGRALWDPPLAPGKEDPPNPRNRVNCVEFSPDGRSVASVNFDGSLVVWRAEGEGAGLRLTPRYKPIRGDMMLWRCAFSDDSRSVATSARGGAVRVYDVLSGAPVRQFRAQYDDTMGVAFLDPTTLVSTGDKTRDGKGTLVNSALMVWDLSPPAGFSAGAGVTGLKVLDDGGVHITTPSGVRQAHIDADGMLREGPPPAAPAARPPGGDRTERAKAPTWAEASRSGPLARPPSDAGGRLALLCDLPGSRLQVRGGADGTLQLWGPLKSRSGGEEVVPMRVFQGHAGRVTAAAVSPDGRYLVSADETGTVLAWDLRRPLRCRDLENKMASRAEFMKNGQVDPDPAALREWYAFRGRPSPTVPPPAPPPPPAGAGAAAD